LNNRERRFGGLGGTLVIAAGGRGTSVTISVPV